MNWIKSVSPALWAIPAFILLIIVAVVVKQCTDDGDKKAGYQAQQTQQSSQAIADAAKNAIATMEDREATDKNIAQAVQETKGQIQDAQSVEAIQSVVTASLCRREAYKADPACSGK